MQGNTVVVPVRSATDRIAPSGPDLVAVEEPLEIILNGQPLVVTMRTPGHDEDLVRGYLYTEGVIERTAQIQSLARARDSQARQDGNRMLVTLAPGCSIDPERLNRVGFMNSSCGICGKTSIASLEPLLRDSLPREMPIVPAALIHSLPARLRESQPVFARTGGLHAAALFSAAGELLILREDIGRHNAVDKLIGAALAHGTLKMRESIMLVSGRAGFELVQKALVAGLPVMAAVGAPSSLAVAAALRFGMTLLGFVRDSRFNIYSGEWRIT